jgi:hypothetical protein
VVKFRGHYGRSLQKRVVDVLARQRGWALISSRSYAKAARRLDATRLNRTDVAEVAAELDASAVIAGKVVGESVRRARLIVSVRDGETGEVIERIRIRLRRGKLGKRGARRLERSLASALVEAGPHAPAQRAARRTREREDASPPAPPTAALDRVEVSGRDPLSEFDDREAEAEASDEPMRAEPTRDPETRAAPPRQPPAQPNRAAEPKRRAAAPKPAVEPSRPARRPPPPAARKPIMVKTDADGQVIDDEMPDVLK